LLAERKGPIVDPWVTPAISIGSQALKHRNEAARLWQGLAARVLGPKSSIVVTGAAGVGKTVLVDHLTGDGLSADYQPPGRSIGAEKERVKHNKQRLVLTVVPGQHSLPRLTTLDQSFNEKSPPDGLIFTAAYGFAEVREQYAREALVAQGLASLDDLLAAQRKTEIDALEETLDLARRTIRLNRKPTWLLVAVNKVDLFADELVGAQQHYLSPDGDFSRTLDRFLLQVGKDNFTWNAQPVCGWLEDFTWNGEDRVSTLKPGQRNKMVLDFLHVLGDTSAAARG